MEIPLAVFVGMIVSFLLTLIAAIIVAVKIERVHERKMRLIGMLSRLPFSEWSVKTRQWMIPIIHNGVLPESEGMDTITYALKEAYDSPEETLTAIIVDWDISRNVFKGICSVGVIESTEESVQFESNCATFTISYDGSVEVEPMVGDSPCRYRDVISELEDFIQAHPKFTQLESDYYE